MSQAGGGDEVETRPQNIRLKEESAGETSTDDPEIPNTDSISTDIGTPGVRRAVINSDESDDRLDGQDSPAFAWHVRGDGEGDDLCLSVHHDDWDTSEHFCGLDSETFLQAVVFVEDAYYYRSIQHNIEAKHLWLYQKYHSTVVIVFRYAVITLLHLLAFVEYPSSLAITSDPRSPIERTSWPCWSTQLVEFLCLMLLLADNLVRAYLVGRYYFIRQIWDVGAILVISVSIIDWSVSSGLACQEIIRFRRLLRPYFILQNSSLMKKIVNCLRRTLPEVMSVLLLLALHLYVFTLFGMLLFPVYELKIANVTADSSLEDSSNSSSPTNAEENEGSSYFRSLLDSLISLLVLLTTANNPDVTMPAYSRNRFAAIFFILYLFVGVYCFMNMLLAVIYNQFRGYFLNSMQSSLLRRRLGVRAAFEVLLRKKSSTGGGRYSVTGVGVGGGVIKAVIDKCLLPKHVKAALLEDLSGRESAVFSAAEFHELFTCLDRNIVKRQTPAVRWLKDSRLQMIQRVFIHRYFNFFGMGVAFINLIIISVQLGARYDISFRESHSTLRVVNFTFAIYYVLEQLVKFWAFGWRKYLADKGNIYDAVITSALIVGELVSAILYGIPYFPKSREIIMHSSSSVMWNILRLINILIMARMLKVIPYVQPMSVVAMVLVDMIKNMKSFAGIMVVIIYAFAIFGMQLFQGAIVYETDFVNRTFVCGSYEQLDYWANNFNDFYASVIVLWNIMIVNNWQVFLEVFRNKTSPWSYLYFIAWWLLSVILILNLFTALIMENFIMKWDQRHQLSETATNSSSTYDGLTITVQLNTVQSMFRDLMQEPADSQLLSVLHKHRYLKLHE